MVGFAQISDRCIARSGGAGRRHFVTSATITMLLLMLVPSQAHAQKPLAGLITRPVRSFDRQRAAPIRRPACHPSSTTFHRRRKPQADDARSQSGNCLTGCDVPNPLVVGRVHVQRERAAAKSRRPAPTSVRCLPSAPSRSDANSSTVGFSFQSTSFSSFEGVDLDSGELSFIREHNDCCPAGGNAGVATSDPRSNELHVLNSNAICLRSNLRSINRHEHDRLLRELRPVESIRHRPRHTNRARRDRCILSTRRFSEWRFSRSTIR